MRLLLDTCALIWLVDEPSRLSGRAAEAVDDAANELLLSDAAVWEMALKAAAGKLTFPVPLRVWLVDQRATWHFDYVPIRQDQILRTLELERHHTDPIDRLMIAQALTDDLSIVTPDGFISKYPVRVVW